MRYAKPIIPLLVLLLFPAIFCLAAEPPTDPILRIETGRHTAVIKRIAVDAAGRRLVTASDDKTLRLWELPSGRPLRVIRPPIGFGDEGKLYAVALSPDGRTIACGGWTTIGSEKGATIYLFDSTGGAMKTRLTGLPNVINHLAFSPDGRFLAATLASGGIRLYRTGDWFLTGEDSDYGGQSYFAHFSRDSRLVTTCWDGYLRLYGLSDGTLNLTARVRAPGGERPFAARFSPDGSRVAVGYDDTANVSAFSGRDLALLYSPDTNGVKDGTLSSVAWSTDGRLLYAGGDYRKQFGGIWKITIRRWSGAGRGSHEDTAAAANTIFDLAPLPDGGLAYGAGGPAFGVLSRDGKRTLFVPPAIADYRNNYSGFRVSGDGTAIAFGYEYGGRSPVSFDLATRRLTLGEASSGLKPPATGAEDLEITGWMNTREPKLNGSPLTLKQYERSHSLAVAADGNSFLLGTEWLLRRFDREGKELWMVPAPAIVWAVNLAANAGLAVAAYGDGTIRWHRLADGKEILAFFPHADRKRWVLWTPSGYYDASPGGEELIGWHVNHGKDQAADFFPASRFRSTRYRPDVIARVLDTLDEGEALRLANEESGKRWTATEVANLLPPVVTIIAPGDGAAVSSSSVTLRYTLRTPADAPATEVCALVDGRPVSRDRGIAVKGKDGEQTITLTIPERDCEVSLIAENRNAASEPATVRLTWAGRQQRPEEFSARPRLYALAVGVSAYRDRGLTLGYPAKDARDFGAVLTRQKGLLYRDVTVRTLTDANATRDDIMDGLEWLQKEVTARDVGIIFIAGHGVNDQSGIYYYLPQNADTERLKRTGVAFSDIKNTLSSLAGKAVLFVDTCHSGNVMGTRRGVADINAVVNELSSAENGAVVFASSTGRQYSLEDDKWGNGAFTRALVEGLDGKADYGGKGSITINMLDLYLSERVKELTGGRQTPTTTKPQTIPDFPLAMRR